MPLQMPKMTIRAMRQGMEILVVGGVEVEEVKEVMKSFTPEERSMWEEVQVAA